MRIVRLIGFQILMVALCTGCFPYRFTTRPGVSGTVVDSKSRAPLSGATVTVALAHGKDPNAAATTGNDGTFTTAPKRQWALYIFPMDVFLMPFTLQIRSEGYQAKVLDFRHRAMGMGTAVDFGLIPVVGLTK